MINFLFSWSPKLPVDVLTGMALADMSTVTYLLAFFLQNIHLIHFSPGDAHLKVTLNRLGNMHFFCLNVEHCE